MDLVSAITGPLQYAGDMEEKLGGRAIRGLLGGHPRELLSVVPFSDTLGITDPHQRVTGGDLAARFGLEGEGDPLGHGLMGMAIDAATDPMSYLGLGAAHHALSHADEGGMLSRAIKQTTGFLGDEEGGMSLSRTHGNPIDVSALHDPTLNLESRSGRVRRFSADPARSGYYAHFRQQRYADRMGGPHLDRDADTGRHLADAIQGFMADESGAARIPGRKQVSTPTDAGYGLMPENAALAERLRQDVSYPNPTRLPSTSEKYNMKPGPRGRIGDPGQQAQEWIDPSAPKYESGEAMMEASRAEHPEWFSDEPTAPPPIHVSPPSEGSLRFAHDARVAAARAAVAKEMYDESNTFPYKVRQILFGL